MAELKELVANFHFTNEIWAVLLPFVLIATDFLTGFINAWSKGEVKSAILRKGLAKKIGEIVAIALGELFVTALDLPTLVASGVSIYIIVMELISICENLDKMGVPIPKFVKRALAETSEKINEDDKEKEDTEGDE